MQWNSDGVNNKKTELEHFLHTNKIDICCLQETHLQEDKPFKIRGYQMFRSDRQGRKKGGVMTLVRNNINAYVTNRFMEGAEFIEVMATTKERRIRIVNYYCPNDKPLSLDNIQVPSEDFLILGDFNSRSQSWGYNSIDKRGEDIEAWQDEGHLILVNDPSDTPTFYSQRWHTTTTPDLAFCTDDVHKVLTRTVAEPLGGSDHRPVLFRLSGASSTNAPQHPRWNYKKANWTAYAVRTNELLQNISVEGRDINNIIKDLNHSILKAAKETIPRGVTKNYTPYWNEELEKTHSDLAEAREEAERNPSQQNNNNLQQTKAKYLRTAIEAKRKGWRKVTSELNLEKDTTKLWKLTRAMNDEDTKGQKITLKVQENVLTEKGAANEFAQHYANESNITIQREREREIRKECRERVATLHDLNAESDDITMAELQSGLRQLKKKKSPGPDGITNELLQHLGNTALRKLLSIYNHSYKSGIVPQVWKEARMIPILKKGKNKSRVASYRPISLTSCTCKLLERIINHRLHWILESDHTIVPEQAGFRQFRCTEDQTAHLSQIIEDAFQAKKATLACFIDLQRAFDKVWKDGLLVKLLRYGIHGRMYKWIKSYLHNRTARVQVDGRCGRKVLLREGVPQGGVLSPSLFIIFINDIVSTLPKGVHAALYADDLVLWCSEEYASTATYRMQVALNNVVKWANLWCVSINKEKSKATLFTLSTKEQAGKLMMGETQLTIEDKQTYLGVTFDKRLTWKPHIENAEEKGRHKLNIMRKLAGTTWGCNETLLKTVYQGSVRPHLEYGSSSWMTAANSHLQTLDRVQNQALRIITGAMRSTPIQEMEKTTGIPPLSKRRECRTLTQAVKYEGLPDHPMNTRLQQLSSGRLKRTSFARKVFALKRDHQHQLPKEVDVRQHSRTPPWRIKSNNFIIRTSVPHLGNKDENSDIVMRTLTQAMIEDAYPGEAWVHAYTDGSATDARWKGGAGFFIQYPNGQQHEEGIPTGLHCTNFRAEAEALVQAADTISRTTDHTMQVVFLTDALSVLQAINSNTLPDVTKALHNVKCHRIVLQWIPSHCGVEGNERADRLAKAGASETQLDNKVTISEKKAIAKTLFRTPTVKDSYHQLTRQQQVVIFRLRTGHCRLNQHMYKKFRLTESPKCHCGEDDETVEHVLQHCHLLETLRKQVWPTPVPLQQKLHGSVSDLHRTTDFISRSGLQV
jgi:ribonuclease HI